MVYPFMTNIEIQHHKYAFKITFHIKHIWKVFVQMMCLQF